MAAIPRAIVELVDRADALLRQGSQHEVEPLGDPAQMMIRSGSATAPRTRRR